MIICFSGTGNTRAVSDALAAITGDEVIRLAPGIMRQPEKMKLHVPDKRLIWAFPVHGWGLPKTVDHVIRNINIFAPADVVHHLVCTCGDDVGLADQIWRTEIAARGWRAMSAFSVQMPNTYTFLKGFDVDSEKVKNDKLDHMQQRVAQIAATLRDDVEMADVVRGSWPWTKSYILGTFFRQFLLKEKKFHAIDECIGCGKCARNCPLGCINIIDGRPQWECQDNCTMCSRCYHVCPTHALHYGKASIGKGQYMHPDFKLK